MADLGISEVREFSFPPVGTFVDSERLKLVSIIGTGGYGVVYHAVDAHGLDCRSYAVKCLIQADERSQSHTREIALHGLACSHPGIVTLHRVVEEDIYRYFIMEYAPDQDLFVQILHKCRYLGNDALVKDAFLQLLDAIEHCHSLGIYHRDLKPENVVCFEDGCRLALTDFGLATTQDTSGEFKTGSVYHMSPGMQYLNFLVRVLRQLQQNVREAMLPMKDFTPLSRAIYGLSELFFLISSLAVIHGSLLHATMRLSVLTAIVPSIFF